MHLLTVALDRCQQFGARRGMALHAEQHRGERIGEGLVRGIEFDGAAQCDFRLAQAMRTCQQVGEEFHRQWRVGGEGGRHFECVDRLGKAAEAFQQDAAHHWQHGVQGIVFAGHVEPGHQGVLGAGCGRAIDVVQSVLENSWRKFLRPGERRFRQLLIGRQQ